MSDKPKDAGPVGGIPFYIALVALGFLATINLLSLTVIVDNHSILPLSFFGASAVVGIVFAMFLIRGRLSVFLHELKHSILSGLVGNRARGMKVRSASGHFEYAYSKHTAHMNAFIALAPYWLPVFTTLGVGLALLFRLPTALLPFWIGLLYGIDILTGLRDASPEQPDLYNVRGGFAASVAYLLFNHLLMLSVLIAWVAEGTRGLQLLGLGIGQVLGKLTGFSFN